MRRARRPSRSIRISTVSGTSGTGLIRCSARRANGRPSLARSSSPAIRAAGAPPCCAFGSHGPRVSSVGSKAFPLRMKSASKAMYVAMLLVALTCCGSAAAAPTPLGLTQCGPAGGVYQCSGLVKTWDGVPLDTTVTLPSADAARPLPLIADIHGFGNSKWEYLDPASEAYTGSAYTWAKAGYAVLTYTARGLWGSCGTPDARLAGGADCARGWIHLADVRYEARDTQELIGRLVDDGTADGSRIGVTGDSYGGGQSLELAALRNRVMLQDGRLVPWRSPKGVPLSIAAAAPVIPWSDLMYAIAPNGRTLTYAIAPQNAPFQPVGVF